MKSKFFYHKLHHYYLAEKVVNRIEGKILDYGCGDGEFIGNINSKYKNVYGYEVDLDKLNDAKQSFPHVKFNSGKINCKLPYPDKFFDAVIIFHVLEHVNSEVETLEQIYQVLKPNGLLIISSPYKGLFSWADMANLRYKFPSVHKILGSIYYGNGKYNSLFVDHQDIGLFGDSVSSRKWHYHYKEEEIRNLLKNKFIITNFHKYSLFQPFLLSLWNAWHLVTKSDNKFISHLIYLDNKLNVNNYSYNFFLVGHKK